MRLEHHGVVAGGEQAGEVRGAGPFSVIEFVLSLFSGTQRRVK